jgi:ribosomal protein S18 acetylase RimI-like enzyme
MHLIQTDPSDEALVTAIRANMSDLFRLMSRTATAEGLENDKFTRWHSPLPHPWFNGVLSTAPFEETDDAFIEETVLYFRGMGVDTFTWWMDPPLRASDWKPALSQHGFGFSDNTPGMAAVLQALDESQPPVDGLEVRAAADDESLRAWAHVFTLGYGMPLDWEDIIFDIWLKLGLDLPVRNYLGYLNGEPVSTSCLFLGGGAAGIYSVATLPEARGKGIGAALTLKPLQDARAMGYRIGVLQSSKMGFGVYKRLGFRHLCQIENYYLSLT